MSETTGQRDGGPAFPVVGAPGAPEDYPGMSLRDRTAIAAMQALIGAWEGKNPKEKPSWATETYGRRVARYACGYADAMLAERERRPAGDGAESGADPEPPPTDPAT